MPTHVAPVRAPVAHRALTPGALGVTALAALCALAAPASADLMNGDFSSGLIGWTWTPDANSEPAMFVTTGAGPLIAPPSFRVNPGSLSTGLGSLGGTLSQSLMLTADVNYAVTGNLAIQNVSGSPNADGGTIEVFLGGFPIHTFDVAQINAGVTAPSSFGGIFTPGVTGLYNFEVHFGRDFPNFVSSILHWADNFSIVPAPGTLILAPLALAFASARRRRD